MIDFSSDLGQRALKRLQDEEFIWLTVVNSTGTPIVNPVWFLWQENSLLIYSRPTAKRLQHIATNPKVALNFNADETGDKDIMIFAARAEIDNQIPRPDAIPAYIEKYRDGIARINMTVESFSDQYTQGFRVYPSSLRGY